MRISFIFDFVFAFDRRNISFFNVVCLSVCAYDCWRVVRERLSKAWYKQPKLFDAAVNQVSI